MLFRKEGENWVKAYAPVVAATDAIVEAYISRERKPSATIKEGYKTSYSVADLELWKQFCQDNEIVIGNSRDSLLLAYRLLLGEDTIWVEDGNPSTLIPMGKPHIDVDSFLRIIINYLFSKQELQEGFTGKRGLADWLAVSVPTVDRLLKEGMPSRKIKNRRVFNKMEVDRWLRS